MQSLIENARAFSSSVAERRGDFTALADEGQRPQVLFISCSDARIVPSLITGARPGEIIELRTAGNIVPRHRSEANCAVGATLEYAVIALGVPDIVVCGHSCCDAVQDLVVGRPRPGMAMFSRWLQRAEYNPRPASVRRGVATQHHLKTQLEHLRSYPCVARRLRQRQLRLHGWFYDIASGEVLAYNSREIAFRPL
ncbi:carbonic anhydrase [Streptomyces olivaceiscleroticus]|uniref:carbonic anhydrase n=1 Tax=Streptomyces olivaceiscleroticus TaxID=68245 RepID=A0ABP3L473_9ACTN